MISISNNLTKETVFLEVSKYIEENKLSYTSKNDSKPWGGYFVVDDANIERFIELYFPDYPKEKTEKFGGKLSPKILVVEPNKRLSWQYHHRRAELWRVVTGPVGFIESLDDVQSTVETLEKDEIVQFDQLVRHRLIGLDNWGVVAEIWQHTDTLNPSDEDDIVRVEDDFGR